MRLSTTGVRLWPDLAAVTVQPVMWTCAIHREIFYAIFDQLRDMDQLATLAACLSLNKQLWHIAANILYRQVLVYGYQLETFTKSLASYQSFIRVLSVEINALERPEWAALDHRWHSYLHGLTCFTHLTSFSFRLGRDSFDSDIGGKRAISFVSRESLAYIVDSLPASCKALEIDTEGHDRQVYSMSYGMPGRDLCVSIGNKLARLEHVRLKLHSFCAHILGDCKDIYQVEQDRSVISHEFQVSENRSNKNTTANLRTLSISCSLDDISRPSTSTHAPARTCIRCTQTPPGNLPLGPFTDARNTITPLLKRLITQNYFPKATSIQLTHIPGHGFNITEDTLTHPSIHVVDFLANTTTSIPYAVTDVCWYDDTECHRQRQVIRIPGYGRRGSEQSSSNGTSTARRSNEEHAEIRSFHEAVAKSGWTTSAVGVRQYKENKPDQKRRKKQTPTSSSRALSKGGIHEDEVAFWRKEPFQYRTQVAAWLKAWDASGPPLFAPMVSTGVVNTEPLKVEMRSVRFTSDRASVLGS